MKRVVGIMVAVVLQVGFILFGGWFFLNEKKDHGTLRQVDLVSGEREKEKEKDKPKDAPEEKKEELEADADKAPDSAEIVRSMATPPSIDGPALADASLGAIEAALNGLSGSADFGGSRMSYESGGRLGATGKGGPLESKGEGGFSLSEIDQKPRCVFQASPVYPAEMRGRKFAGAVIVLFIVDATGKVTNQRVEKSSHQAFDRPALDAVRQWKFEPGVKGGQRVACRMRVSIRFEQS